MTLLATLAPHSPVAQAYGRVGDPRDLPALLGATNCANAMAGLRREQPNQAARVIAGWLSTREAIWWGALCQSQLLELEGHDQAVETLKSVVLWVREPGEPSRLAVANREKAKESASLAQLATAVTLTAESLSPYGASPVAAPMGLAHRMAALSVLAAANEWPTTGRKDCLDHFLEMGLDVSECKYPWSEVPLAPHPGLRPTIANPHGRRKLGNIWEDW